jgi:predicted metal-dependent hydrolase
MPYPMDDLHPHRQNIEARERLDFGLDAPDIPRHWLAGDAYKSRFFDALSTMFPVGERFFMECVRDFRDQVQDPKMREDIRLFIRQEGQHTMVHNQYNARLKRQGIDVEMILRRHDAWMFGFQRRHLSKRYTLALTAAMEHLTAISAHALFDRRGTMDGADPRVRAMYAWHAIEEVEHRAVAFDLMQGPARVGYLLRCLAMLEALLTFFVMIEAISTYMHRRDGTTFWQRMRLRTAGAWWVFKPSGFVGSVAGRLLAWFKPGFHPDHEPAMPGCAVWTEAWRRTADPVAAGDALHAAGI